MPYLFDKEPTFDSLNDNLQYEEVKKNLYLYVDCYVIWNGRVTNIAENKKSCEFLVGYDSSTTLLGTEPLVFDTPMQQIDTDLAVRILAKIAVGEDGKSLVLKGTKIYQPLN